MNRKALVTKIKELTDNPPNWSDTQLTLQTRKWLSDVYAVAKQAELLDDLADLKMEITLLTDYLGSASSSSLEGQKKTSGNKIQNILFRALSVMEVQVLWNN